MDTIRTEKMRKYHEYEN